MVKEFGAATLEVTTPKGLGVDPVLVRVAFALSILITGLGLVAWVVPAVLMPRQARVSGP